MTYEDRRRRLRAAAGEIAPLDQMIRRLRRSDEVAALQVEVASLRDQLSSAALAAAAAASGTAGDSPAPDDLRDAPGAAWPDSVAPFLSWYPPGHFYSPVPDLAEVERDAGRLFAPRTTLAGLALRTEQQLACFRELAALARSAPIPSSPGPSNRYGTDNLNYGVGDASMLQAMLRHLRPRRYLEVGSGWSTALALDTSEQYLDGTMSVTAIEPYPELLYGCLRPGDPVEVVERRVQDVALERFEELEAGDVLFVDSSHVLKVASDVHFLFTSVLPLLAPGVHVHVHDMFWPFEYLRHWIEEGRAWNECYLVHAFLLFNDTYEIVLFNHYLAECHRDVIAAELPAMLDNTGGALWLRRAR